MSASITLASLMLLAGGAAGHKVDAQECRAELTMPAEPQHEVETRQIGGATVRFHRYSSHVGTTIYAVSCAWAPGMLAKGDDVETGLTLATNGLLASNGAVRKSSSSVSLNGVPGQEAYGTAAAFSMRVRSYLHKNGHLSILVLGPADALGRPEANAFFASLKLGKE